MLYDSSSLLSPRDAGKITEDERPVDLNLLEEARPSVVATGGNEVFDRGGILEELLLSGGKLTYDITEVSCVALLKHHLHLFCTDFIRHDLLHLYSQRDTIR